MTAGGGPAAVAGVEESEGEGGLRLLADWQVLQRLNGIVLPPDRQTPPPTLTRPTPQQQPGGTGDEVVVFLRDRLGELDLRFAAPEVRLLATVRPEG